MTEPLNIWKQGPEPIALRDWFAGMAMMSMVHEESEFANLAVDAYAIADAMLAERAKGE